MGLYILSLIVILLSVIFASINDVKYLVFIDKYLRILPNIIEYFKIAFLSVLYILINTMIKKSRTLKFTIVTNLILFSLAFLFINHFARGVYARYYSYNYKYISNFLLVLAIFISSIIPNNILVKRILQIILSVTSIMISIFFFFYFYKNGEIFPNLRVNDLSVISIILLLISVLLTMRELGIHLEKEKLLKVISISVLCFSEILYLTFLSFQLREIIIYELLQLYAIVFFCRFIFYISITKELLEIKSIKEQEREYLKNTSTNKEDSDINVELEQARSIQQSLLPTKLIKYAGVKILTEFLPCEQLSGDFYDIYKLDKENIGMFVVDVSGHGVSAALLTMYCRNLIRSGDNILSKYRSLKPNRNLQVLYDEFNKMNFPSGMHMVMFIASYNTKNKILTYSSGGLNNVPILVRKTGEVIYLDESEGFPICKMKDYYTPKYTSKEIQLLKDDRVIFFTDGLIDNFKNFTISEDVLVDLMLQYRNNSIESLNNEIKSNIGSSKYKNGDDISYFIMEVL